MRGGNELSENKTSDVGGQPVGTAPPEGEGASGSEPSSRPFVLRAGGRVRMGPREGRVLSVRGASAPGDTAYDVLIRWEGDAHSEWFLYATLRRLHQTGTLDVLEEGRGTLRQRVLSLFTRRK